MVRFSRNGAKILEEVSLLLYQLQDLILNVQFPTVVKVKRDILERLQKMHFCGTIHLVGHVNSVLQIILKPMIHWITVLALDVRLI